MVGKLIPLNPEIDQQLQFCIMLDSTDSFFLLDCIVTTDAVVKEKASSLSTMVIVI